MKMVNGEMITEIAKDANYSKKDILKRFGYDCYRTC